jgi:hypothetical protein
MMGLEASKSSGLYGWHVQIWASVLIWQEPTCL